MALSITTARDKKKEEENKLIFSSGMIDSVKRGPVKRHTQGFLTFSLSLSLGNRGDRHHRKRKLSTYLRGGEHKHTDTRTHTHTFRTTRKGTRVLLVCFLSQLVEKKKPRNKKIEKQKKQEKK